MPDLEYRDWKGADGLSSACPIACDFGPIELSGWLLNIYPPMLADSVASYWSIGSTTIPSE